jgi:hypothetical protein
MGQEENAQRKAKHESGIGSRTYIDHGYLREKCPMAMMRYVAARDNMPQSNNISYSQE